MKSGDEVSASTSIQERRLKRKSIDYHASKPQKIQIDPDDSDSSMEYSSDSSGNAYVLVPEKKPKSKPKLRGYKAGLAARAAREAAVESKGWEIATQEEPNRSGMPISLHAGGRFRNRNRGRNRGRGARNEMLASHRRIVDELREQEIEYVAERDGTESDIHDMRAEILVPLSEGKSSIDIRDMSTC